MSTPWNLKSQGWFLYHSSVSSVFSLIAPKIVVCQWETQDTCWPECFICLSLIQCPWYFPLTNSILNGGYITLEMCINVPNVLDEHIKQLNPLLIPKTWNPKFS